MEFLITSIFYNCLNKYLSTPLLGLFHLISRYPHNTPEDLDDKLLQSIVTSWVLQPS